MPHEPVLVGIDLGTTGCRSAAFDGVAIDCSASPVWDPTPNEPSAVGNAMKDSGIIVKARVSDRIEEVLRTLDELVHPDIRLILDIKRTEPGDGAYHGIAERNYKLAAEKLNRLYHQ